MKYCTFYFCQHWWLTFCGLEKSPFLPCDFQFESVLILLSTVTILLLPVWYWPVALHIHNISVLQFWHTQYTYLALLLILHWYRSVVTAVKLICCSYSTDSERQTYLYQIYLQNGTVSDMNIFGCVLRMRNSHLTRGKCNHKRAGLHVSIEVKGEVKRCACIIGGARVLSEARAW